MKIIHCADIHLGSKMETNLSKEKAKIRKEEIFDAFNKMIEYASSNNIKHIIISGDLIDSKNVSSTVKNKVLKIFNKHSDINFYYLEGNHDAHVLDLTDIPSNLFVFNSEFKKYVIDDICIGGICSNNTQDINFDNDKYNILLLHGNVVKYNSNEKDDIYLPNYNGLNINYFALGHIHKNEVINIIKESMAVYSGCLEGRGFDEAGSKGFYVLDINDKKLVSLEFVNSPIRSINIVNVDISSAVDSDDILKNIKNKLNSYSKNDLFKVILTGEYELEVQKNIQRVTEKLNEEYYFVKIEDQSKLKINYKDYENDISLLGEFVRTVLDKQDLSEDERNKILEYGIKALKNEDL